MPEEKPKEVKLTVGQLLEMHRQLESNLQLLRAQEAELQNSLIEIAATIDAIKELKEAKKAVLATIGSGCYINVSADVKEVTMHIGQNIFLKKKPNEAIKILESRQKQISKNIEELRKEIARISNELNSIRKIVADVSRKQAGKDVQSA